MPNFIARNLKNTPYPFGAGEVEFLWEARGRKGERLVYTKSGDEIFFIEVKKNAAQNAFVIKGEKVTKPARIGLLQNALKIYRDLNTSEILSEAFAVKNTRLTQKASEILDLKELSENFDDLAAKFGEIFIEIGFGSGRHLLYQAQNNSNALIIGIEVYKPSIEQVAKLARARNLDNVRLINTDARLLLSLIGSNLVDKIFLHFPVPWDKAEHRRVVSSAFIAECERTLKIGGNFELRTDSREYFDFSAAKILELKNAKILAFKNRNLGVTSKYEDRWKRREKDIYDLIYTCETKSGESKIEGSLNFGENFSARRARENFKNETIRGDDFFVHFEEIYEISNDEILLRVALGAFNKPEQCYVKISKASCEYFIKRPMLTRENLKAHETIEGYLKNATNY